jgi:hypothetical protein
MSKTLLGTAVAIAVGALAFSGTAQAQCWWTKGYNWHCSVPSTYPSYYPPATGSYYYPGGYPTYIYPYSPYYPPYWVLRQ